MTITERAEKAVEYKANGNNCCQAVALALADQTGFSPEQLRAIAAGFGGGMGNMQGTCGALVGAGIIAGIKTNGEKTVPIARQISEKFQEKSGAVICKELKAKDPVTGKVKTPCDDCVRNAVYAYCKVMNLN